MSYSLLIIPGSLRDKSYNKSLAREIHKIATEKGWSATIADIEPFPFFDQDAEADFPAVVQEMKDAIRAADGIIVVTPAYNRSVPGVLKNAIDWTSRPYGDSAWTKKPVAIIGSTIGVIGASAAQFHLRQIFAYLDAHIMGQPEVYISGDMQKFDVDGNLTDEDTHNHVVKFVEKFAEYIAIFKK